MRTRLALFIVSIIAALFVSKVAFPNISQHFDAIKSSTGLQENVSEIVTDKDPSFAFDALEEAIIDNPEIENECHDIVHEIGHEAYKKYGLQESFTFQNDMCGSGYIHGIVEAYFKDHQNENLDANSICIKQDGRCFHGIGHGFMYYYNYDLHASVQKCMKLNSSFAKSNCTDGVFMQYFSTGEHDSVSDSSLMICTQFQDFARGSCFFYGPRYHLKYSNLVDNMYIQCKKQSGYDRDVCIKGMGSGLTKFNINNLRIPENFCFSIDSLDQDSCVRGMLSYFIVHFNDHTKGKELCDGMLEPHRNTCQKEYQNKKTLEERLN